MTDDSTTDGPEAAADVARRLSASGKTYAQIAEQMTVDKVPRPDRNGFEWSRRDVQDLMGASPAPAGAASADTSRPAPTRAQLGPDEYERPMAGGGTSVHGAPSPAAFRAKALFWIRMAGWIMVVWALLSLSGATWLLVDYHRAHKPTTSSARPGTSITRAHKSYSACIMDPSTTTSSCDAEFPNG